MKFAPIPYHNSNPDTFLFLGVTMKILIGSAQTGNQFCMIEGTMPPGEAPPMHMHLREDESMLQLEGELEVTIGERTFSMAPGQAYFAPRGIPHRLRNISTTPARSVAVMTPGGFDELVRRIGIPVVDGVPTVAPVPPTPEEFTALLHALAKAGIELAPPPAA